MNLEEYKQWLKDQTQKAYAELRICEEHQQQRMGDVWYGRWESLRTALYQVNKIPEDQT